MVTICDHLGFLRTGQAEHEVLRESTNVTLDSLVKIGRFNTIHIRQIAVQQDFLTTDQVDLPSKGLGKY